MPEVPCRHRLNTHGLLDEPVEELPPPAGSSAIEPERELVQVGVQVRDRHAPLVDAQEPAFQQRHDPVDTRQQVLPDLGLLPDDLVVVAEFTDPTIPLPPIRPHCGAGFHCRLDSALQRLRGGVGDTSQADAPDPSAVHLGDDADQDFPARPTAGLARLGPPR